MLILLHIALPHKNFHTKILIELRHRSLVILQWYLFSADPTPNSTHIHTTCPRVFNRVQGNYIYTFTWRVDFSEAFLSAVNNSRVDLFEIDPQGKVQNPRQNSLIANIARNVSTIAMTPQGAKLDLHTIIKTREKFY